VRWLGLPGAVMILSLVAVGIRIAPPGNTTDAKQEGTSQAKRTQKKAPTNKKQRQPSNIEKESNTKAKHKERRSQRTQETDTI